MDRNILIGGLAVLVLIVIAIYVTQEQEGIPTKTGTTTYYVLNYKNDTNTTGIGLATKLANGSYRLSDGTIVPATEVFNVSGKYVGQSDGLCCPSKCPLTYDPVCGIDGNTYVNLCGAALSNVKVAYKGVCNATGCGNPCIEPKPELRFVCESGQIVKNRIDCQGNESCPYVVSKYFICPDGKTVKDPSECSAQTTVTNLVGIQTMYVCSDGREVTSEADCSVNCVPATTAVTHVSADFGYGGVVGVVYECWDGRYVKKPKDCPPYCNRTCYCTYEYNPVCANGQTYGNPCFAKCAGVTSYAKGPCKPLTCAKKGEMCTPAGTVGTTLTHLSQATYPTCCEKGSYCSANGVCVPTTQCKQAGQSCTRPNVTYTTAYPSSLQGDCCAGLYCDENRTCTRRTSCGTSGQQCGWSGGAAAAPTYLGACCKGYACVNNSCAKEQCVQEYGSCIVDADCCSGLECSSFGQCKKPCVQAGSACKSSIECCGDLGCVDNVCAKKNETTPGTLCSGPTSPEWGEEKSCATGYYEGIWGTYCGYCSGGEEYRYYCVVNYSYTATAMPTSTLTDQVARASLDCDLGCSGTTCE